MKRNKIYYYLGTAVAALALAACSDEINTDSPVVKDGGKVVSVVVSDHGFDNANPATRANDSNEETIEDNKTVMTTTFTNGDSIGVFAITQNNIPLNDTYVNKALYYENGVWKTKTGQEFLYYNGVDYFAYYPYKEGVTIADVDPTNHTAEGFFHDYIAAFEPYKDQYTQWRYTRSDLMVGQGALVGTECQFQMKHVMGLIVIQVPYIHHTYTNVNDNTNIYEVNEYYTMDQTEKAVRQVAGSEPIYRYIVKPNVPEALTGKTYVDENGKYNVFSISHSGVDGGYYKKYVVDNGTRSDEEGTFDNGYIIYQDGTITEDKLSYKTPLGIIIYCGTDAASENRHGLAINPSVKSYSAWCTSSSSETVLTNYAKTAKDLFAAYEGYENTLKLVESSHTHLAKTLYNFNSQKKYACPYTSTGWFMPAIGQILAMFGPNGAGQTNLYDRRNDWFSTTSNNSSKQLTDDPKIVQLALNMNAMTRKFNNTDFCVSGNSYGSWASTLYSNQKSFRIVMWHSGKFYVDTWDKTGSYTTWGMMAF